MQAFADLIDRLTLTPQRNGKLRLLQAYFAETAITSKDTFRYTTLPVLIGFSRRLGV